jgi:Tol biopolymer transport system component
MTKRRLSGAIGAAAALGSLATAALAFAPAQTGSGKIVFATSDGVSKRSEIAVVRPDGTGLRKLTHLPGPGEEPRWTTDGREILFVTEGERGLANWRMRSDGRRRERLPGGEWEPPSPSGDLVQVGFNRIVDARGRTLHRLRLGFRRGDSYASEPLWSPDSRYLAITVATETAKTESSWILVVRTDGRGGARAVTPRKDRQDAAALSWSPDSRRLVIARSSGRSDVNVLYTIRRDGSQRRRLITVGSDWYPDHSWSPDSRRIAYVGRRGGIFVLHASGGRPRRLVGTQSRGKAARDVSVDWSSRGELAFRDVGGIYAVRSDGRDLRRITRKSGSPDWSPDGRRLVFAQSEEIFVVGRRGGGLRKLTQMLADGSPQWSPDGKRIAFTRHEAGSGRIYVMAANGNGQRRIASGHSPRWSPDGQRLVFMGFIGFSGPPSMQAGRIMTAEVNGSGKRAIARGNHPTWAPDGERIAFVRSSFIPAGRDWEVRESLLFTARADGSDVREVLRASEAIWEGEIGSELWEPRWSPDGRTIAVGGYFGLRLVDVSTGTVGGRLIPGDVSTFEWSPRGNRIAYAEDGAVGVVDVRTGTNRTLARFRGWHNSSVSWSPDGRQIAFTSCTRTCDVYAVNANGSPPRRLTKTVGIEAAVDWGP